MNMTFTQSKHMPLFLLNGRPLRATNFTFSKLWAIFPPSLTVEHTTETQQNLTFKLSRLSSPTLPKTTFHKSVSQFN